jgi:hypothetical protein
MNLSNGYLIYFQKSLENFLSAQHSLKIGKKNFFQKSKMHKLFWNVASENKKRVLVHGNKNPPKYSFSHDLLSANQKKKEMFIKKKLCPLTSSLGNTRHLLLWKDNLNKVLVHYTIAYSDMKEKCRFHKQNGTCVARYFLPISLNAFRKV